jgi:hypothetical protein
MCLAKLFSKPTLPYPEEKANYNNSLTIPEVMNLWLTNYQVPLDYYDFWRNHIVITLDPTFPYPAGVYEGEDGRRNLIIRPEWLNPGIIAHEQAHNAYALLTPEQQTAFALTYSALITTDKLIKLLYSKNNYGLTSTIEGYAELYRYLGGQMPQTLKPFYPKLF